MIASIPIITHPLPPIEDYMNHLARMHVIAAIGHVPNLAEYYEIDWQIVPNLVMDILLPPLARFVNIYMAGQIFTISTFALIVSGTLAVNRVLFGRWSALPLIVCPLLYNFVFLVGIMNYLFGVGLALWALAAWLALLDRPLILRLAVSTAFVIALFFCHLYAVGIYGIEVLALRCGACGASGERPRAGKRPSSSPPACHSCRSSRYCCSARHLDCGIMAGSRAARSMVSSTSSRSTPIWPPSRWWRSCPAP